ncbi:piggyBac transposable element-derived protein 4 [Trichonephila clavata]|uniref:PiggyBac transposable element-derived protein 4 n=1 Tax=Trichonephila clavata TaxID=2740835 RepID=A0A8X6KHX2_TRICU|nr:piggyBac transposable element-derived protein 4 [Trichonephila clavata]
MQIQLMAAIWQRCDSKTGYVYDMNIYSGKETGEVQGTLGDRVVSTLTETIRGKDPADERSGQLMDCVLQTQTSKHPILDFIVPLAEALMMPRKLNAHYQSCRGPGRPSKTSRSLLNFGDHLTATTKTRGWCRECTEQKKESRTKITCMMCNVPLCIDCFKLTIHN